MSCARTPLDTGHRWLPTHHRPRLRQSLPWQDHLRKRFDDAYEVRFGHSNRDEEVEIVNLRGTLVSTTAVMPPGTAPDRADDPIVGRSESWAGSWIDTSVVDRRLLPQGAVQAGPTIVLEEGCTTYVPPGWSAAVHDHGHLLLTRTEQ